MRETRIGAFTVTRVEEMLTPGFDPAFLFPEFDPLLAEVAHSENPVVSSRDARELHDTGQITEPNVDELDVLVLDEREDLVS